MKRITTTDIRRMKSAGDAIPMVTAYDYTAGRLVDEAGIPMVLVGDSMGQTMLGHDSTLPVTVDDIIRASAAVVRGAPRALVVADMPFMSYQVSREEALKNSGRIVKEGGAQAVKLEGGAAVLETVRAVGEAGIAVMGHLGLTPQAVHRLGGYRAQATTTTSARELLDDARRLEDAGVFSIVLELVPGEVAEAVTSRLAIPTIGIGSGVACDGQVQVWHDILGLSLDMQPRHAKVFGDAGATIRHALRAYSEEVRERTFPTEKESVRAKDAIELAVDRESGITPLHRQSG